MKLINFGVEAFGENTTGADSSVPKISIVTVCKNEESGIRKTCESVCRQSFKDFEWIVIDGASTDGTLAVLSEFKLSIKLLVSEADAGIYDAMNKGISFSSGDHILFLNGGDYLAADDVLQTASQFLGPDLVFGDVCWLHRNGRDVVVKYPDVLPEHFLLESALPHQATFIRRKLFLEHGLYDTSFKIHADHEWFVRMCRIHKVSCSHIPRVLAVFREGGISTSSETSSIRKVEFRSIQLTYFPKTVWLWWWLRSGAKRRRKQFRKWCKSKFSAYK
jgi:glycosyltransferase involved in cell wall biosynthesis